jgi:succinate-semialdehyde dehydrogenase/glutarate-semialdehyde dehydrogenase
LALAELAERAGIPKGVLNIVTTHAHVKDVGKELSTNKDIRKVSFTGSTAVGKIIMELCASTMKRVSLELGGNAPFIIFGKYSM